MDWFSYLIPLILLLSWMSVSLYQKHAIKNEIISNINHRTLHKTPTPRGGGVVFSLLIVFCIFILQSLGSMSNLMLYVFGFGGLAATLFGFVDDVKDLTAGVKLIVQLFLSGWVVYWLYSSELLLLDSVPFYVTISFAFFFMVWMINAYNFIDGIDGMAASTSVFVSSTLAIVLFATEGPIEVVVIFALISTAVCGFMFFNWPPATIFMGDAGSLFLGYMFGSLLLFTVLNDNISIWTWLTVFGYFFADTTLTQIMRVILVKQWYLAHRSHAYQNLARITGSHSKVTISVVIYNLLWVLPLTLWSTFQPEMGIVAAFLSIIPALVVAFIYGPKLSSS